MAGWSVLFQVEAQSRQFAVWHQDQVVKLLPAFSGACSAFEQRAGKRLSPGFGKVQGNQEQSAARAALASDRTGMLLTPCFFLSSLSFSRFNLSRFDEATSPEVTMTESHTPAYLAR